MATVVTKRISQLFNVADLNEMEEEIKEIENLITSSEFKQWVQNPVVLPREIKSTEVSEHIRKSCNEMFKNKCRNAQITYEEILRQYSISVATAENDSEARALAHGNRSHILMLMSKYEACIKDIDRALNITSNKKLSIKLLLRKVKCLHALGSKEFQNVFQEAKNLWKELPDARLKISFQNDMNKVKLLLAKPLKQKSLVKDRQSEMLDELAHQYKVNDFSAVKVHYNEKYGRHLIAARDFRPGDVIYIEKPFVRFVNPPKVYAYCSYCYVETWASIPCDHCALNMFCSEECKNEAWMKYHHEECKLYFLAKGAATDRDYQIAFRMLVMAVKENESVKNLRLELMTFDKCIDRKKGFVVDEKIKTDGIKSIYNLSRNVSNENLEKFKEYAKVVLAALAQTSNYFGNDFVASDPKSYKKNDDAIFLGALFLRLCKISHCHRRLMWNHYYDYPNDSIHECKMEKCSYPASGIAPVSSLLNHSCHPNAGRCYTKNGTIILYAIQPIKKTSQIFECYIDPCVLDNVAERQKLLFDRYNFNCYCTACQENWSANKAHSIEQSMKELPSAKKFVDLVELFFTVNTETLQATNYNNTKTIIRYRHAIEKLFNPLSKTSAILIVFIDALQIFFNYMYGIKMRVNRQYH